MTGKITLVTPPDIFENSNLSILFAHIDDEEQDFISKWFAKSNFQQNVNFYVYSGETDVGWFLYALNLCEYKYINIDCVNYITQSLSGHALGKNNVFYKTQNENLAGVYSHINSNRIEHVKTFLESIFGGNKTNESQL